jgi:hypothetical protein
MQRVRKHGTMCARHSDPPRSSIFGDIGPAGRTSTRPLGTGQEGSNGGFGRFAKDRNPQGGDSSHAWAWITAATIPVSDSPAMSPAAIATV